jgi:glycosyltransferase involved in cell wall biosynthesis
MVLVTHPAKQHAYEVAVAFQNARRLTRLLTGVYDTPNSMMSRVARQLPRPLAAYARPLLDKRRNDHLDPLLVTTWPYAEAGARLAGAILRSLPGAPRWEGYLFVNWANDQHVARQLRLERCNADVVYGFLGGVAETFRQARHRGLTTVLDVPMVVDAGPMLAREREALGLSRVTPGMSDERLKIELSLADWIIAPSEAVAESLVRQGFQSSRISIVPFGADVARYCPPVKKSDHRFRVLYAGRLESRKGVHYLLEAWSAAGIDGELVLAGSAPETDYVNLLRARFSGSFVEAGNLSASDLAQAMKSADVFVFPSLAEGSALVTYEALSAGLPAIVTHEAGSVVRDGVDGFIVPARSSQAIAARLKLLYSDLHVRTQMSIAARARAEQYPWQSYYTRLVAAVDEALDELGRKAVAQ